MEEKNDFEKLFISYLLNELNAEDEAYVIKAINADPVVKKDFEDFKNLLRLVHIKQNIDAIDLLQERTRLEELWKSRQRNQPVTEINQLSVTGETKKPVTFGWYVRAIAAAASIILVLGFGWLMVYHKPVKAPSLVSKDNVAQDTEKVFTRFETNVSGQPRRFLLPDGTEVTLFDQSIVSFTTPFAGNKRDISLKGKASFKVAKDKTKPFTVYSDGISTTALGTEFSVTSFAKENIITVRLKEGKVVVKSPDSLKENFRIPFYLLPGQELVYNKQRSIAIVRKFKIDPAKDRYVAMEKLTDDPSLPKNNGGTWFMFNNQSLPQIFNQLELIYNVEIVYNRKDVEKLYFIGKFDKKDSLDYILKSIVTLNNLTLSKQKSKYIIHKQD
ncbi:MAG TPA: FecR family protein [Chitinophagaceae bacterium]|nr:FecR family protein [Chitinophagaceae bacterium]